MAFCSKCGSFMADDERFCSNCGANRNRNTDETPASTYTPVAPKRGLNVAQLVWSIINLVCGCVPLGIAALILVLTAKDAPDDATAAKRNRSAMICNIIATVIAVLYIGGCFVYGVLVGLGMVTDSLGLLVQ